MARKSRKKPPTPVRSLEDFSGVFLIASPDLRDPNFTQSVVLVVEQGEDGAFGLVLNRPMEMTLENVAQAMKIPWKGRRPAPAVYSGGPVMTESVWLLHDRDSGAEYSKPVHPGIHFTAHPDFLKDMIRAPAGRYRFFLGYAGWSEEQLSREIAEGYWLLPELDPRETVFSNDPQNAWPKAIASMGVNPDYYVPGAGLH